MRISDWSSDVCSSDLSFRTQETLLNGAVLRDWLGASGLERLYAVSSRPDAAVAFGVPERQGLAMAETVGGRYSLWRSEERRVGTECVVRVVLGGRRCIKKKR